MTRPSGAYPFVQQQLPTPAPNMVITEPCSVHDRPPSPKSPSVSFFESWPQRSTQALAVAHTHTLILPLLLPLKSPIDPSLPFTHAPTLPTNATTTPTPTPPPKHIITTFWNGRYCVFLSIIDLFNSICLSLVPVWLALDDVLFLDCRSSGHDLQIRRRYPQRYASSCPPHAQIHTHTHTLKRGSLLHNPSMLGTGGIVARVSHPKLVCAELPRRIEFWGGSGHVER